MFETSGVLYGSVAEGAIFSDGGPFGGHSGYFRVYAAYKDSLDRVWEATSYGIVRYNPGVYGGWNARPLSEALPNVDVACGMTDHLGRFWFGTTGGLARYQRGPLDSFDPSLWKVYTTADGLPENHVVRVLEDHLGDIWAATIAGVCRFDGTTWTTYTGAPIDGSAVTDIVEDRGGGIWFATLHGAVHFDGTSWLMYGAGGELPASDVRSIECDRRGDLWFATSQGVTRYDGTTWKPFAVLDDPTPRPVYSIFQDHLGALWFSTSAGLARYVETGWLSHSDAQGYTAVGQDLAGNVWCGSRGHVSRFDGSAWTDFYGVVGNSVTAVTGDRSGNVWFGTATGLSRFDGETWTTFTTANGLASDSIFAVAEDTSGAIWAGTNQGVCRFSGGQWTTFTAANGLGADRVLAVADDRAGGVLIGAGAVVSRFNGSGFSALPPAANISLVLRIQVSRQGSIVILGLGPSSGTSQIPWVARLEEWGGWYYPYDSGGHRTGVLADEIGEIWVSGPGCDVTHLDFFSPLVLSTDAVPCPVTAMFEDRRGDLWIVGPGGASRHTPDRVAPRTIVVSQPAAVTTSRFATVVLGTGFNDPPATWFYTRLDGVPTATLFSRNGVGVWANEREISDGPHALEVWAHDAYGNTDSLHTFVRFEVDATPPAPLITAPAYGSSVRGVVSIYGTAADPHFLAYTVEVRPVGATSWLFPAARTLVRSDAPVTTGLLAQWDASKVIDGPYEIRLELTDGLNITGTSIVTVNVDNRAPFADQTTPVTVTAGGGDVYTTNVETHLYFPPHAFPQDAVVTVTAADPAGVPATLPDGTTKVLDGYDLSWAQALEKAARFTMSYAGTSPPQGTLAIYRSVDGTHWERLGGTFDTRAMTVTLAVTGPGRYALFAGNGIGEGRTSLSAIVFTPRVFSPSGAFADRQVGISFHLGKPALVTVKVFSKSGRLIREVASGLQLNAGDNLIRWDGTDRNGGFVADGTYLVTVEALGQTQTRALAVVK
jgi:ligand-binding sensor domain-containing protein